MYKNIIVDKNPLTFLHNIYAQLNLVNKTNSKRIIEKIKPEISTEARMLGQRMRYFGLGLDE